MMIGGPMSSSTNFALFLSVFLACAVEAVEAVTIVLAAGTARDWKSAFRGVAAGLLTLALIIGIAGPAISRLPMSSLRILVGGLLLVFGLQWLRKAILRSSGYKALHDEDQIFREEVAAARAAGKESRIGIDDWYAFTLSYKGVLLEGLEVAFIVLTFGTIQHQVGLASIAAISAVVIATITGLVLAKPLSRVPENSMKFSVGILLTSFGIFWGAEGSGAKWPGDNWAVLGIIGFVSAISFALVIFLKRKYLQQQVEVLEELSEFAEAVILEPQTGGIIKSFKAFGEFWYDFIIGDDWTIAVGIVIAFFGTEWLKGSTGQSWYLVPLATALLVSNSLLRATKN
jgi:uncharacterized membrane protein